MSQANFGNTWSLEGFTVCVRFPAHCLLLKQAVPQPPAGGIKERETALLALGEGVSLVMITAPAGPKPEETRVTSLWGHSRQITGQVCPGQRPGPGAWLALE